MMGLKGFSISKQLLIGVVTSSAIITVFVTIIHLAQEYKSQVEITRSKFDSLMYTNKKALENSIWDLNNSQIDSVITGLKNFPGIDYLKLEYESTEGMSQKSLGNLPKDPLIQRYDLAFDHKMIGNITFYSSNSHIYNHLWGTLLFIIMMNTLKTFLASFLILYVINFLLTRHLLRITSQLNNPNIEDIKEITLKRKFKLFGDDELQKLTTTINFLLSKSNRSTAELKQLVEQRTKELDFQLSTFKKVKYALDQISMHARIDSTGMILECNAMFEETFKLQNKTPKGRNFLSAEFLDKEDINFLRHIIEGKRSWRGELSSLENGKNAIWISLSIIPDQELKVKSNDCTLIASDITEKRRQQKRLDEARKSAEIANITKSQFLANMSHEIRTPLNGILGITDQLLFSTKDSSIQQGLQTVKMCGASLLELINDILDFSKIEEGKLELEVIPFNIEESIQQIINLLQRRATDAGNKVIFSIEDEVPQWILGDPYRFKQIITNLLGNAIKFTKDGIITLAVSAKYLGQDEFKITVDVSDSGIGIDEEAQKKLFKSFSQADSSTSRNFGGSGLGLAISKSIVEHMGGKIWVKSQKGHGSIFSFAFISKKTDLKPEDEKGSIEEREEDLLGKSLPLSILIAEDNEVNQDVILGFLNRIGYSADISINGKEAFEAVQRKKYDVILMDCHMPIMDGYEATRKIKNLPTPPKVIALTASSMKEDQEKCYAAGMDTFLSKPIRLNSLKEALIKTLKKITERS